MKVIMNKSYNNCEIFFLCNLKEGLFNLIPIIETHKACYDIYSWRLKSENFKKLTANITSRRQNEKGANE